MLADHVRLTRKLAGISVSMLKNELILPGSELHDVLRLVLRYRNIQPQGSIKDDLLLLWMHLYPDSQLDGGQLAFLLAMLYHATELSVEINPSCKESKHRRKDSFHRRCFQGRAERLI